MKGDFLMNESKLIYLDSAATTKVFVDNVRKIKKYSTENYGNPMSVYDLGCQARKEITNAREEIAKWLNCKPNNIVFTSGGSEANTMAIIGVSDYLKSINKTHLITTAYEHSSVLKCFKRLETLGFSVTYLDVSKGYVSVDDVQNAIQDNTGMVSIMYANNELGYVNPIEDIGKLCNETRVLFHTDCVQAAYNLPIDFEKMHIDFCSISGHKLHAPKGIGCLCVRDKSKLTPIIFGGNQEESLRGGTENVAGIVCLGNSVRLIGNPYQNNCRLGELKSAFISTLLLEFNDDFESNGVHFNSDVNSDNNKVLNIRFDGVESEALILMLSSRGVCISAGSACSVGSLSPSHVLTSFGLSNQEAISSVRISFSVLNSTNEAQSAAKILAGSVKVLRAISKRK